MSSFRCQFHLLTSTVTDLTVITKKTGFLLSSLRPTACLFSLISSCLSASHICSLTPETGPCEAYMPRYFHNQTSGQCDKFIYGGCQGNSNSFPTFEICQEKCRTGENMTIIKLIFYITTQHN